MLDATPSLQLVVFINGLGGAFAGFFVALVYNAVAGMMGGIVINLDDAK